MTDGTLLKTLNSLAGAGFDKPTIFIDGVPSSKSQVNLEGYECVFRTKPLKVYGNWHLGLSHLFIRNPHADRFAMFQDDFVTYKNLRTYLNACPYPEKGYWNLYTFRENMKPDQGWYQSNQLGKGAVALVFNNEAAQLILNCPRWLGRPASNPSNKERLWKYIDGGIVETFKKQGWKEYVHNPSLVQHTGLHSSIGNMRHAQAPAWKGEEFDAINLARNLDLPALPKDAQVKEKRLGLVGFDTASGLGELNRQIVKHGDVYRWLVRPHSKHQMTGYDHNTDQMVCPTGVKIPSFLDHVGVVLFAETPYYDSLVNQCQRANRRIVCIPMQEWMPTQLSGWPAGVDLFLCPTVHCWKQFHSKLPCAYYPWPIDLDRFTYRERKVCKRFVFINGHGGYKHRKGGQLIRKMLSDIPDLPITIYDQTDQSWGKADVRRRVPSNAQLYEEGDVLLCPHSVDGLGLELLEALASGMPVVSTAGSPWNEYPAIARIEADVERKHIRRPVSWWNPSVPHLKKICQELIGTDITRASVEAREWAETRAWDQHADDLFDLIKYGAPNDGTM